MSAHLRHSIYGWLVRYFKRVKCHPCKTINGKKEKKEEDEVRLVEHLKELIVDI